MEDDTNKNTEKHKNPEKNSDPQSDQPEQDENTVRQPVDLNKRKLAMEMEKELGGVFGIGVHDIEMALDRLFSGAIPINDPSQVELPENIQSVIRHLDSIVAIVERNVVDEDGESISAIMELFENYSQKLEKIADDYMNNK